MTVPAEDPRGGIGPFVCGTCLGRGGSCGTCRGTGQVWSYVAKPYFPPAAGRGDTDSGGEAVTLPCPRDATPCAAICGSRGVCGALAVRQHPARPAGDRAQPTQELREAIAGSLHHGHDLGGDVADCLFCWDDADALLAGPLAALLDAQAAVNRVRELHAPLDRGTGPHCQGCATHVTYTPWPCKTIRALDGTT